jgi:hypothetical protein
MFLECTKEIVMDGVLATLIILALFLLRFMVPLAVTFAFGYGMNRLMNHRHIDA